MNTLLAGRLRRQVTTNTRVFNPREARYQEPVGHDSDGLLEGESGKSPTR